MAFSTNKSQIPAEQGKTIFFPLISLNLGDKIPSIFGKDLFFGLQSNSGTESELEVKFAPNFMRIPNAFGKGCKSVPPHVKFYSLSTSLTQTINDLKSTFFLSNKITLFGLHTIEFCRSIGNLQSMKGRMLVKRNWRKSRIIFLRENKHVVQLWK